MVHCPTCGSPLRFDIASQLMVCDYCRNSFQTGTLPDRISDDARTEAYFDSYAYLCPSCGAEINTTDKNDAVGFCPYCKGSSMIRGKGSFEKAVNGIYALRSQGIFTSVSFTAQNNNKKELKKLAAFCEELGVNKLWFDRVIIPADDDKENLTLSSGDFRKLCRTAARLNKKGQVFCGRALQFIPCKDKLVYQLFGRRKSFDSPCKRRCHALQKTSVHYWKCT